MAAFCGLPHSESEVYLFEFERHRADAHGCLCVIDLWTGDLMHWLWFAGILRELYDVVVLPGVRRPSVLGFRTDEIPQTITPGK